MDLFRQRLQRPGRGACTSPRSRLGEALARQERELNLVPLDSDTIVVPVPDTGKSAADAMAYALGLRSVEGLMRKRYVGRTFIEGENRPTVPG